MSLFARHFMEVLREDALERKAMETSLEDDTNPEDFDTSMEMGPMDQQTAEDVSEVEDAIGRRNQMMINELQHWITEIEQFLHFLNSEDPSSVQSRLAAAEPDTVMDKMKQTQQTKISRVASDLASLHQNFLGFMAQTSNSKYKYV